MLQISPFILGNNLKTFPIKLRSQGIQQGFCQNVLTVRTRNLNGYIIQIRSHGQTSRCCDGKGSCGPDDNIAVCIQDALAVLNLVGIVEGSGVNIVVFDFCLSKGWFRRPGPVNWLGTAVNIALVCHSPKDTDLGCFKLRIEGHIRIVPVTWNTQTLEILTLLIHLRKGIIPTHLEIGRPIQFLALNPLFGQNLLNGQTVGIPTWDIRGTETWHRLRPNDDILGNLVEGVAYVDISIGIGRAIMEMEGWLASIEFLTLLVDSSLFPFFLPLGFLVWKTSTHWKGCFS